MSRRCAAPFGTRTHRSEPQRSCKTATGSTSTRPRGCASTWPRGCCTTSADHQEADALWERWEDEHRRRPHFTSYPWAATGLDSPTKASTRSRTAWSTCCSSARGPSSTGSSSSIFPGLPYLHADHATVERLDRRRWPAAKRSTRTRGGSSLRPSLPRPHSPRFTMKYARPPAARSAGMGERPPKQAPRDAEPSAGPPRASPARSPPPPNDPAALVEAIALGAALTRGQAPAPKNSPLLPISLHPKPRKSPISRGQHRYRQLTATLDTRSVVADSRLPIQVSQC